MLSDEFPTFEISLEADFQSSDNKFPPYPCQKGFEKETLTWRQGNISAFSTIGKRNTNLDKIDFIELQNCALLAIYDGHSGIDVVQYLQQQLLNRLKSHMLLTTHPNQALIEVLEEIEKQVIKKFVHGSTALVAIILHDQMVVANVGDCKLFGMTKEQQVVALTRPHNLSQSQEELTQVISKGGIVLKKGSQYRLNGQLNLSRSIGDQKFKHCLSSEPEIYNFSSDNLKKYQKIIMATDGFYNGKQFNRRAKVARVEDLAGKCRVSYQDNASALFYYL